MLCLLLSSSYLVLAELDAVCRENLEFGNAVLLLCAINAAACGLRYIRGQVRAKSTREAFGMPALQRPTEQVSSVS